MKRLILVLICLFASGCTMSSKKLGPESFVDLAGPECGDRLYPHLEGEECIAGELNHFSIKQLTDYGERPVWSPDGKKIAFMEKEFGNAYELDLASGNVECITCDFEHEGFLRVHYMKDGDYLLLGPKEFKSEFRSRYLGNGFFWMPTDRSAVPRWLGEEHYEGVAISRESRQIAYAKTWFPNLLMFPSRIYVAEITPEVSWLTGALFCERPRLLKPRISFRAMLA